MSNAIMSWEKLWLYYNQADREIQADILKQIDLENFLPMVPVVVRREVMKMAPIDIRSRVEAVIPLTQADEVYRSELKRLFSR